MASFTSEEVESVIERLVRATIRRPYDTLGVRRTDVTFTDIQEAAAGVFLLYQRTPFYFAFLASSRLREEVAAASETALSLIGNIEVLKRRVLPVKDVSALANARAALFELESAVNASGPPRDVTRVPAFVRFNANVDRFLGAVGSNIKDKGAIVPTPNEARKSIPEQIEQLKASMENIVARVSFIANALSDYADVNLPQLLSKGIITRARQVLSARVDQLEKMSEEDRLEVLRETVLEVLGTRAVVRKFGQFSPPQNVANLTGTGTPFSDAERPANEAFFDSEKLGPYALVAGNDASTSTNVLRLYADGAASFPAPATTEFFLPLSPVAKVEGTQPGPFNIVAGLNDELVIEVNGAPVTVSLTAGAARTPAQVAADITAGLVATNFQGEAYFFPLMFDGEVVASGNDISLAYGSFPPNSVNVGDEVDFYFGPDAPTTRTVTAVSPSLSNPQTITVDGAVLTSGNARVRYGAPTRRVRIVAINKTLAVANKHTLKLNPTTDIHRNAGIELGMYGSLLGRSLPTDAEVVANYVSANSTRFRAETRFVASFTGALRTITTDIFGIVFYDHRGTASWGAGQLGLAVTLTTAPSSSLVGKTLCLREGNEPDVVGLVVTHVGTALTVDFASPVTSASGLVEVGPTTGISPDMVVNVAGGQNDGRYFIDTVHATIPFQFKLRAPVPLYRNGFNESLFMTGTIGQEGLRFFSKAVSLASEVEIYDPLTVFMNAIGPTSATGTTKYFKLPSKPNDLETGDFLEFHTASAEVPDYDRSITRLFTDTVVELGVAISSIGSWPFGVTTLPFARLRTDKVISFEEFSEALEAWLEKKDTDTRAYFIDLARFIQPLLVNENPTASDVGSAENRVRDLLKILTITGATSGFAPVAEALESILASYEAPFVPEADALVRAFKEKGADRAVDILLNCRFTSFFGLDQEETSYSGAFQKTLRQVAATDLPVRKVNRLEANISPLRSSVESVDFETETPDLDDAPNIDPPVTID